MNTTKKKLRIYEKCFKRLFDFTIALLALIILSPILLIVAIIQLFTVGHPIIFAQYRPGRNGKVFKLYKFRSMSNKKDKNGKLLPDSQRLTTFGKILRKTGIDELPQLINILKGDMSLIGPRPRLVKDMIFYDENQFEAYSVRPGITCLSQISGGRSEASWDSIFEKDMEYAKNITFWGDIKILFKTFIAVFKKEGQGASEGASTREYYYPDHLLKSGQITKDQYNKGLAAATKVIEDKGQVSYQKHLHKNKNDNK